MEEVIDKNSNDAPDADAAATRESIEREKAELGIPDDPEVLPKETAPETPPVVEEKPEAKPQDVQPQDKKPEEVLQKPQLTPEEGKELKRYKEELRMNLQQDFDKKLEELRTESSKTKPNDANAELLETDIEALAKTLNFDKDKTKAIIEVARKGLQPLSPEDKQALEGWKADQARRDAEEQRSIFNAEFNEVLPSIKSLYPNANNEQLEQVKSALDIISHSEKYHSLEMSDIVTIFANKEFKYTDDSGEEVTIPALGKVLFSPKQKTFESSTSAAPTADEVAELPDFNPNWTPAEVEKWEKQRDAILNSAPSEKLHIISSDDRGRIVERYE